MTFDPAGDQVQARVSALTAGYVTTPQLKQADEQIMEQVQTLVQQVDTAVDRLEQRLDANAAAARQAAKEREQWKQELAKKYLSSQD
jgi:outer membrane murein-binding lipoprotein Lpp